MRSAARLSAGLTGFWAFTLGAAAYLLGVQNSAGQRAENAALQATRLDYDPGFPLALVSPSFIVLALLGLAVLGAVRWGWQRALVVLGAGGGAVVLSQVLKLRVLQRPDFWSTTGDNTFPSGHATIFTVLLLGTIIVAPQTLRSIMSVCAALGLIFINSQILLIGWHRASDVVGAVALALLSYCVLWMVFPPKQKSTAPGSFLVRVGCTLVLWAALVAAAVFAFYAWIAAAATAALWASVAAVIAVSVFAVRQVLRLVTLAA